MNGKINEILKNSQTEKIEVVITIVNLFHF